MIFIYGECGVHAGHESMGAASLDMTQYGDDYMEFQNIRAGRGPSHTKSHSTISQI